MTIPSIHLPAFFRCQFMETRSFHALHALDHSSLTDYSIVDLPSNPYNPLFPFGQIGQITAQRIMRARLKRKSLIDRRRVVAYVDTSGKCNMAKLENGMFYVCHLGNISLGRRHLRNYHGRSKRDAHICNYTYLPYPASKGLVSLRLKAHLDWL